MQNRFIAYLKEMYYQFRFCTNYIHVTAQDTRICDLNFRIFRKSYLTLQTRVPLGKTRISLFGTVTSWKYVFFLIREKYVRGAKTTQNRFIAYSQERYYQFRFCTNGTRFTAQDSRICNLNFIIIILEVLPYTVDQSPIRKHSHEFIRNCDIMEICFSLGKNMLLVQKPCKTGLQPIYKKCIINSGSAPIAPTLQHKILGYVTIILV